MNENQENIQQNETAQVPPAQKVITRPLLWGLFAILMSIAAIIFPLTAVAAVAFGSLSFALMKLYAPSRAYEILLPAIFAVASLLITDSLTLTFFLLGAFLPGGYAMAWVIGARKSFTTAVSTQFLVYIFYAAAVFLIGWGEIGNFKLDDFIEPFATSIKEAFGYFYDILMALPSEVIQITFTRDNFIYDAYRVLISTLPSVIAIFFLAASTISYWMAKSVLRRKRNIAPESVKFFSNFDLFKVSSVGGGIYVIISLLALVPLSTNGVVIIGTIENVMNVIFCYAGASVIGFFFKMKGTNAGLRGLIYAGLVVSYLFVPMVSSILSLIGLADCFFHLRRFIRPSAKYM